MKVYIDKNSITRFTYIASDKRRRYYITNRSDKRNVLIVCRNNLNFHGLNDKVVDCLVGNDCAWTGFAWEEEIGLWRSKITIFRILKNQKAEKTLSKLLKEATQM